MIRLIKIFLILILIIPIVFHKKVVKIYYLNKFKNWVERPVEIEKIYLNYSGLIELTKLRIFNIEDFNDKDLFKAERVIIEAELRSIFSDLIIIKKLDIINPEFFLEIKTKKNLNNKKEKRERNIYEDNIGLAKKINEITEDKVWTKKKRDVNFIILESNLSNAVSNIKVQNLNRNTEIKLSDMKFTNVGNKKNIKHYKDVLKFILYEIFLRTSDMEIKKIIKNIYKF